MDRSTTYWYFGPRRAAVMCLGVWRKLGEQSDSRHFTERLKYHNIHKAHKTAGSIPNMDSMDMHHYDY